nr:MAG TPA: hypothetical protein [Caudoviricetes sp.]
MCSYRQLIVYDFEIQTLRVYIQLYQHCSLVNIYFQYTDLSHLYLSFSICF